MLFSQLHGALVKLRLMVREVFVLGLNVKRGFFNHLSSSSSFLSLSLSLSLSLPLSLLGDL